MQCSSHQWTLLELQKVIDYIEGYCILFGSGEPGLVLIRSGGLLGRLARRWYVISMVTRYVVQSLQSARGSFLPFKTESV